MLIRAPSVPGPGFSQYPIHFCTHCPGAFRRAVLLMESKKCGKVLKLVRIAGTPIVEGGGQPGLAACERAGNRLGCTARGRALRLGRGACDVRCCQTGAGSSARDAHYLGIRWNSPTGRRFHYNRSGCLISGAPMLQRSAAVNGGVLGNCTAAAHPRHAAQGR